MSIGKKIFRPAVATVTLNPALDRIYSLEDFSRKLDQRCRKLCLSAGGKGINVSRTLGGWRVPSIASGFLGGHTGEAIRQLLAREEIRHDFVSVDGESRVNMTIFDERTRSSTRILEEGPRVDAADIRRLRNTINRVAVGCDYVVFSGQPVPGAPDHIYQQLVRVVQQKGSKAVLDASGAALRLGIKARPFLIKPNLKEAEDLLGKSLKDLDNRIQALRDWHASGVKVVVLTMGAQGVLASDGQDILTANLSRQPAVSTVGNGDALLGGFLAALCRGGDFEEAVSLGVACGAANALNLKPGTFSRELALRLRRQVVIRKIKKR